VHVFSYRSELASAAFDRPRRLVGLMLLVFGLTPAVRASGQSPPRPDTAARDSAAHVSDTTRLSPDSLAARLERAEAAVELLRRQLATEASSVVRTRSRLQVELWAQILVNGFVSLGPLNSADVPTFATNDPAAPAGANQPATRALGMSVRQSRVGMSVAVDSVLGGTFAGDVELDFFAGGAAGSTVQYLFPQPRLRTAKFTLRWPRTELLIGSETPLISGLSPVSVASVGIPGFADAGNLWYWLPQLRITREIGTTSVGATSLHWAIQGAILDPYSGVMQVNEEYGVDASERSARPYLEARLRARWGPDETEVAAGAGRSDAGGEVGVGVHHGWIQLSGDTLTTNEAVSVDARIGLHHGLELRGEAYRGRALAGLGGGGIGQNFGAPASGTQFGPPLRDTAGWMQLNWRANPTLITGAGCGIDAANLDDRPVRQRNESCAAHLEWRPVQPLLFGVEVRRLRTTYATGVVSGSQINLAFGFEL
jgi:hypothetical protein